MQHLGAVLLYMGVTALQAAGPPLDNRNLAVGKIHIQNHAQVDEAPFFTLQPLRMLVVGRSGVQALFQLQVVLETYDAATKAKLEPHLKRLYSAMFEDVYGVASLLWGSGYTPSLMDFKKRMQRVVYRLVKKDLVKDVLVQKALFRSLKPL